MRRAAPGRLPRSLPESLPPLIAWLRVRRVCSGPRCGVVGEVASPRIVAALSRTARLDLVEAITTPAGAEQAAASGNALRRKPRDSDSERCISTSQIAHRWSGSELVLRVYSEVSAEGDGPWASSRLCTITRDFVGVSGRGTLTHVKFRGGGVRRAQAFALQN